MTIETVNVTQDADGSLTISGVTVPVAVAPPSNPPPAQDPSPNQPAAPSVAFTATLNAKGVIVVKDLSINIPEGSNGSVGYGDGSGGGIRLGGSASYGYKALGTCTVQLRWKAPDGTIYSATATAVYDGQAHVIASDPGTTITPPGTTPSGSNGDGSGGGTGGGGPSQPPVIPPGQPALDVKPRAFSGAELHWRDTASTDVVDIKVTLTEAFYYAIVKGQKIRTDVPLDDTNSVLTLANAPVGVTPLQQPDGSDHPELAIARYKDCVLVENAWLRNKGNYSGRLEVTINGVQVYAEDGVRFDFRCCTTPIRTGLTQFTPSRDFDAKMIPNYGNPGPLKQPDWATPRTGLPDPKHINGLGYATTPKMSDSGGRWDIAEFPGWLVPYLAQGLYYQALRDGEDHGVVWPVRLRDQETGMILDPTRWYDANLQYIEKPDFMAGHYNPIQGITDSPYVPNGAHLTHFGPAGYLVTGSDFDLEHMLSWANFCAIELDPVYRGFDKLYVTGNTRRLAWVLLQYGFTAAYLPESHPYKPVYVGAIQNNVDNLWTQQYAPGAPKNNQFGFILDIGYFDDQGRSRAIAPWQNHYLAGALHQIVRMGFDAVAPFRDFSAGFAVNSMFNMCYQIGSTFTFWVVDTAKYVKGAQVTPDMLWGTWQLVMDDTMQTSKNLRGEIGKPCGTLTMPLMGGPGGMSSSTGGTQSYPAYLTPALAAAVDAGLPNAQAMWDKLQQFGGAMRWQNSAEMFIVPVPRAV